MLLLEHQHRYMHDVSHSFACPRYEGNWMMDQKYGYGVLSLCDGSRYEGNFRANHRHGMGKMLYPDGHTEEGLFSYGILVSNDEFQVNVDKLVENQSDNATVTEDG